MSEYRATSDWRVEDLSVGMVIVDRAAPEIDPVTWELTGRLSKLIVTAIADGRATLKPYYGPRVPVSGPRAVMDGGLVLRAGAET